MATEGEVEVFLKRLKEQISVFGVHFRNDRGKNQELYNHISIIPSKRKDYILKLNRLNYSEGPIPDTLHGGVWVFGNVIQGYEVYINVSSI